ncbi:divalent-cation tolerance protein CutA [Streptomyces sp. NPDC050400]|uniref:divalent-cation tolerance protein CutA n=1 Tax=Streptomyces sp. NPDC050400 TaxID=3365610 RepID=UPI00378F9510
MGDVQIPEPNALLTVLTTTDTPTKATDLARGAVQARVAACAQISGPITSVYRWDGALETAQEWQVVLKTTTSRYPALETWLTQHHDYDTPEIIATPVTTASENYAAWVTTETTPT